MLIFMTPPPPPPPRSGHAGPPPPMPLQLQSMMREMQQRQPKFQQKQQMQRPVPYQGGRGRRGRGRGGFQQPSHGRNPRHDQLQYNRKRGPSEEVRDASRFFLPSFLEDPWKALETGNGRRNNRAQSVAKATTHKGRPHWNEERYLRQARHVAAKDGLGRVLFQPSFLDDPWVCFYS